MSADRTHFIPDAGNTRLLRDAFGRFTTGVTVVTATDEDDRCVAITANSFSSVSLDPPLVLWSPSRESRRYRSFVAARHFAIHVLAAEQAEICWQVSRDAYALPDDALRRNADGVPLLPDCLARFECVQHAVHDGGDHAIVLGQVLRADLRQDGDALAFFKGQMGRFSPL